MKFEFALFNDLQPVDTPRIEIMVPPLQGLVLFHMCQPSTITHAVLIDEDGEMLDSFPFGQTLRLWPHATLIIGYDFGNDGRWRKHLPEPDPVPDPGKVKELT